MTLTPVRKKPLNPKAAARDAERAAIGVETNRDAITRSSAKRRTAQAHTDATKTDKPLSPPRISRPSGPDATPPVAPPSAAKVTRVEERAALGPTSLTGAVLSATRSLIKSAVGGRDDSSIINDADSSTFKSEEEHDEEVGVGSGGRPDEEADRHCFCRSLRGPWR